MDDGANKLDASRVAVLPIRVATSNPNADGGARRATEAVHGFRERHVERRLVADFDDAVHSLQSRSLRRRARHWADHREMTIADRNHDAQSAELSAGGHLHLFKDVRRQENGVWVEGAEHPVDGCIFDVAQVDGLVVEVVLKLSLIHI